MHSIFDPVFDTGDGAMGSGQLVLLGLPPKRHESWTRAAQVLGMRCTFASCFDECAAYPLAVGPTVYIVAESSFHPRLVNASDGVFRRTAVILVSDDAERIPFWRLIAWDALAVDTPDDRLIGPLAAARAEALRRLKESLLIEDVRRRQATLGQDEFRVLKAICAGRLNKQIASEQGVSVRTIEQRRRRVFDKMGVDSAVPLAAKMAVVEAIESHATPAQPPAPPSTLGESAPPKPKLPTGLFQGSPSPSANATV